MAQAAGTPVTDVGNPSFEDHSTARQLVTLQPGGYANATLRIDNGRKSADVRGLAGLDDIPRTLRARLSATWQVDPAWKVASGLNLDLLQRGVGNVLDLGATNDRRWSEPTT